MLLVGQVRGPVLRVGDALGGHRVGAQVARHRAVVRYARASAAFSRRTPPSRAGRSRRRRGPAGRCGRRRARSRASRRAGWSRGALRRDARAAREVGPGASEQQRRGHGGQHGICICCCCPNMRAMWRCVTCEISCAEHRGELRLAVGRGDQPGMHADEAAGQRESVDRCGSRTREELEVLARPGDRLRSAARRACRGSRRSRDRRCTRDRAGSRARCSRRGAAPSAARARGRPSRPGRAARLRPARAAPGDRHRSNKATAEGEPRMCLSIAPARCAKEPDEPRTPHAISTTRGSAHMVDVGAKAAPIASRSPPGASSCCRRPWPDRLRQREERRRARGGAHRRDPGREARAGADSARASHRA